VIIEELSRFKSRAEQKDIIKKLCAGTIDIVVGTHRLIQNDVSFKDLGLLIIDEEHKFGVGQKEAIKRMKVNIDTLSLTATPIPRTLQMSLFKLRDFSLIKTPPLDRLSIKTYIAGFRDELIKEAITSEIKRRGQVYFVHNRVETIYSMAEYLKKLMPGVRFAIGHGQMSGEELEKVMMSFIREESDVLICTTIIESGLDIQNANTIIINRADTFGLASLYQLRGRVGRGDRQAYAYLLIPEREMMSLEASRRLDALRKFSDLGSGFNLAMTDLEIRGGGEILGKSQSGHIAAIGYELYMDLLAKQIKRIRNIY
jgi:transcription-repair coupling factor (superfamily II helicase)